MTDAYQLSLLGALVALRSVNPPGNEKPVAEYLARELAALGFSTEVQEILPGRANLVARLLGGEPGREVVLSGHLDVVAAVPEQWSRDPFVLHEEGGRLYGRGVVDMKGAISCMVAAAKDLIDGGGHFKGTLTLLFVADEEAGTAGTLHYVASGAKPDAVIIGEPTTMDVCVAHRGVARYEVEIAGRSGHASRPDDALNPITLAAKLALEIDRRNRELSARRHPVLPPPSIAVTMFDAGEQPNTIPGRCRLVIDRRTLPDESTDFLRDELRDMWLRAAPDSAPGALSEPKFTALTTAGSTLPGSTLAEDCRRVLAGLGVDARIRDFPAGCDQFAFAEAGVDCLLIGPGGIDRAHTVDECVGLDQLDLARRFYRAFIKEQLQWTTT